VKAERSLSAVVADDCGDGFPVVMIHGLGGSSNTFEPLMSSLAGYRVLRPDMPGSARSPMPRERLTIDVLVSTLMEWLTDCGIARFHLVGHSMGTLVCQQIAAREPDKVAGMVLFGALTEPPEAARKGLLARAASVRDEGMTMIADQISKATLAPATQAANPVAAAFVRESVMRQPPEGYARNCEALSGAMAADWRQITAPTLLVTGQHDPVAPVSMARTLSEKIANAELRIISGCGHWTPIEAPTERSEERRVGKECRSRWSPYH